jgi:hypothetical protein
MALEATFRQLSLALHKLDDAFSALQVTVGDTPPNDETALGDALENTVLDIMGTLHETRKFALQAQNAVAHPKDLENARHALTRCQEHFHCIEQQFAADLVSYNSFSELARLGKERRLWMPWTRAAKQGIDQCREPVEETTTALTACWQELADRAAGTTVSVRNSVVGQKIEVPKLRRDREMAERVT